MPLHPLRRTVPPDVRRADVSPVRPPPPGEPNAARCHKCGGEVPPDRTLCDACAASLWKPCTREKSKTPAKKGRFAAAMSNKPRRGPETLTEQFPHLVAKIAPLTPLR